MKSKLALLLLAGFGVSLAQAQTDVSGRLSQQARNHFSAGGGPIMTTATATVNAAPGSVEELDWSRGRSCKPSRRTGSTGTPW